MPEPVKTRYRQSNLAACVLPWNEQFELEVELFEQHVWQTVEGGYKDIYVMGTAGEGYALSERQFQDIVRVFAKTLHGPELRPQVGLISLSMQQVIERIDFCRELGVRMFQISLPSWGALSDKEMMIFFTMVCGRFPDCQFLHYNLARTKRVLTGSDYRRVMDEVPNLVATKNSTSDYARVADLMRHAPDLQHFFLEGGFAFGCMLGDCSLLCSFAQLFPKSTWEYFRAGRDKDWPTLWRLHREFHEVGHTLWSHVDTPHIDGAFDKTFAWIKHERFPNRLLPPLPDALSGTKPEDERGVSTMPASSLTAEESDDTFYTTADRVLPTQWLCRGAEGP